MHEVTEHGAGAMLGFADELRALAGCLARDDGSDLVQDTWVAALAARARPRRLGPWLRQVMRNELRGQLRSRRRRRARELEVPHETFARGPDEQVVEAELVVAMHEAVDALADPYRAVVRARFFDGRTPTEIALEVGSPPATVRWQLHEGLRRIREGLDARYGDRRRWQWAIGAWPIQRAAQVSTMTRFAAFEWFAGLSLATGAAALAIAQWPAPAAAQPQPDAPAARAPTTLVAAASEAPSWSPSERAAPVVAADEPCEAEPAATEPPFRAVLSDGDELSATFASCEHLVPADARDGRFELEVMVRGGPEDLGNTITGVSVTRGRKVPCVDPDADFDQPDGPDVVHFRAVAECIEHSLPASFVEPLPDGESRAMVEILRDPTLAARRSAPALPEPTDAARSVDPEQAIAHFGLVGTAQGAPVSIVECGGYDCSFCRRARATMAALAERYGGQVSLHFLQMPLDMHPTGELAARAALAAGRQGRYWAMHEALFDDGGLRTEAGLVDLAESVGIDPDRFARDLADPELAQQVADQREVCTAAGARGTPSFFINGDLLVGSQAIEAFTEIIDDELAAAGG